MASRPRGSGDGATEPFTGRSKMVTTVGSTLEDDGSPDRLKTDLPEEAGLDTWYCRWSWSGRTVTSLPVPDQITYAATDRPENNRMMWPEVLMVSLRCALIFENDLEA